MGAQEREIGEGRGAQEERVGGVFKSKPASAKEKKRKQQDYNQLIACRRHEIKLCLWVLLLFYFFLWFGGTVDFVCSLLLSWKKLRHATYVFNNL